MAELLNYVELYELQIINPIENEFAILKAVVTFLRLVNNGIAVIARSLSYPFSPSQQKQN